MIVYSPMYSHTSSADYKFSYGQQMTVNNRIANKLLTT